MDHRSSIFPLLAGAAAASLTATAAGAVAPAETYRLHLDHVLGTSLDLAAVGGDRQAAQAAFAAAVAEIDRLDALLSGWRPDSELSRLNGAASETVSADLFAVIEAAESWRARTGGAFDGRLGRVEALWRAAAAADALPASDLLAQTAGAARAEPIGLDPATRLVRRPEAVAFALDGLAKGYVIDAALAAARRAAPTLAGLMVDIGGDMAVWGAGPSGPAWTIGAADPFHPEDNARARVVIGLVGGGAVATSGRGPRDLKIGADRYGPSLSPETGRPAGTLASTVVAPCAMDADALATALSVLGPREGLALVERTAGAEALIVDAGGKRHASSGWNSLAADPPPRLIRTAAAVPGGAAPPAAAPGPAWPAGFVVTIDYELPRPERTPAYGAYVSVWVTDASNHLVRQILLQGNNDNYIDQNFVWWRRFGRGMPQVVDTMSRPTRPAGKYVAVWDGKDQDGKLVGQGHFTIHIEAIREHGLHTYQAIPLDLLAQPAENHAPEPGDELGATRVRYGKRP